MSYAMAVLLQYAVCFIYAYAASGFADAKINMSYDVYSPNSTEEDLPPIILIHGLFDSKKTWKNIGQQMADNIGRMVYSLDIRNHGDSPWSNNFTLDIVDEDFRNFFADHNITKAIFVGHSIGARIAMNIALHTPEMVEKLIVEDMIPNNYNSLAVGMMKYLVRLLKKSIAVVPPGADEEVAKAALFGYWKTVMISDYMFKVEKYDWSMVPLKKNDTGYFWEANLDVIEAGLNSDEVKKMISGVYKGDVLFIYGTHSFLSVERDKNIYDLFPRAFKLAFEGAFHYIHNEYPVQFMREVTKFITGRILLNSEC